MRMGYLPLHGSIGKRPPNGLEFRLLSVTPVPTDVRGRPASICEHLRLSYGAAFTNAPLGVAACSATPQRVAFATLLGVTLQCNRPSGGFFATLSRTSAF